MISSSQNPVLKKFAVFIGIVSIIVLPLVSNVYANGPWLWVDETCNFGSQYVGSYQDKDILLSNVGDATLFINSISFSNSRDFSINGSFPRTIESGSSSTIKVRFCPKTRNGSFSETLTISSNSWPSYGNDDITLIGTATGGFVNYYVYPSPLLFGEVISGNSKTLSLTIANAGLLDFNILPWATNITQQSGNKDHFEIVPINFSYIPEGGSENINIKFHPRYVGNDINATLVVAYYNTNHQIDYFNVFLSGNGIAPTPPPLPPTITLTNRNITGTEVQQATDWISAGPNLTVKNGADVTLEAGHNVILNSGFTAEQGSKFHALIQRF